MKTKIPFIARLLLGLIFFAAGIVGLFNLAPPPENIPEPMMKFSMAMFETGYFFRVIKITETLCGLLLLSGIAAPVALVILAPISINIFLVHFFLTPGFENLILPLVILMLHITAASGYWNLYRPLFTPLFRRNV